MKFRPNVAAILMRPDGRILVCERSDSDGAWQFPQGGVKPDETPEEALAREVREEIGLAPARYSVLDRRSGYRYRFANGKRKNGYDGQNQTYFLLQSVARRPKIDLALPDAEFKAFRWVRPSDFQAEWLPPFKRAVYRRVMKDFFGVQILKDAR